MLQMISWADYIKWVAFGLVVYYGYVGMKFFPKELSRLRLGGRQRKGVDPEEEWEEELEEVEGAGPAKPSADGQGQRSLFDDRPGKEGGTGAASAQLPAPGQEEPRLVSIAHALSAEIKKLVEKAAADKTVKGELIFALQGLLNSEPYRVLKGGPFKEGINNHVRVEAEMKCSIHLDAEELNGLWVR